MTKCKRCWKQNPAEIHTCTPWFHFTKNEKIDEIYKMIEPTFIWISWHSVCQHKILMIWNVLDWIDKNWFRGEEADWMIEIYVKAREKYVIWLYNYYIQRHNKPIEDQTEDCIDYIFKLLETHD